MSKIFTSVGNRPVLDVVNIIAGIALVLSPWFLAYATAATPAWHAWIAGAVIALVAAVALFGFQTYKDWAYLAVGLWTVAAPWVIGFAGVAAAMWAHLILGAVVAVMAAASLWLSGNRPLTTA
ncbi:MAG: hypothetical protein EA385_00910 [Salinarimonadaceae bacterium]|nr:MAG: hypothetical protein EA385_00910 [Salinarimonadaceae bacterium]